MSEDSGLEQNVKLSLDGFLFGHGPIDFAVKTGGRVVTSDFDLDSDGLAQTIASFQAVLTPGDPWQVQVSIGANVPRKTSENIEYRSLSLNTTVRITPGKTVVLWQKGEQKLTLSMQTVED